MRIDIATIFPDAFTGFLSSGLLGKAIIDGRVTVAVHDLRDWAPGPHRKVDDSPFGGGAGMVMAPGPIVDAVESIDPQRKARVVFMSAGGRRFDQATATSMSGGTHLVIVCGRYEGIDDRARQVLGAEEVSIGDFVLAGGEAAAMVVVDAVSRLRPGVMGNATSLEEESFSDGLLEYPHYTRPAEFRGLSVPDVLLSGHHLEVARWRREQAIRRTMRNRPDLLEHASLTDEERVKLEAWRGQA